MASLDQPPMNGAADWQNATSYGGQRGGANIADTRFQGLGAAAANRSAYGANYSGYTNSMNAADQSRGAQNDALGLQRAAAYGTAPSQAELLGRNMIDQSLQGQMAGAASGRGGSLGAAAAGVSAANGAAGFQQQGMNNLAAMRAQEMAQARNDYQAGASGMRQGDFAGAGLGLQKSAQDIQNEQFQRQLNQQGQMGYEQMGQNAQLGQMQSMDAEHKLAESGYETQAQIGQHSEDRNTGVIGSVIGGIGGALGGIFSDMRAKTDVVPLGPPAPMSPELAASNRAEAQRILGGGGPVMPTSMGQAAQMQHDQANQPSGFSAGLAKVLGGAFGPPGGAMAPPGGGYFPLRSDELAKTNIMDPGGMEKLGPSGGMDVMGSLKAGSAFATAFGKNPGGNPTMFSDDRTKLKAAWHEGNQAAQEQVRQMLKAPAAELRENPSGMASAIREAHAGAWDEGHSTPALTPAQEHAQTVQRSLAHAAAQRQKGMDDFHRTGALPPGMTEEGGVVVFKRPPASSASSAPMAEANRALAPSAYAYKPEFTPPDQKPGEKNVGPMANTMAADPVAATAVYKDPSTGLLAIDRDKALKLSMGGVGALQEQVDGLASAIRKKFEARGGAR